MQRSKKDELRERVEVLPDEVKKTGADPFAIDVVSILSELREDYDKLEGEELVKDARAINSVSKIVHMQDRWLSDRLKSLGVSQERLKERLYRLDLQLLASCLYSSQHLPAAIRHISTSRLKIAADYWISLTGWGKSRKLGAIPDIADEKLEELNLQPDNIERELNEVRLDLLSKLSKSGITYEDYLSKKEGKERVRLAYIISLLCASGEITVRFDPSVSKYLLVLGDGNPDSSVAIAI